MMWGRALLSHGAVEGRFDYAGVSVGGAVGLHLCLLAPGRVASATLVATGARIGTPQAWEERARLVEAQGTAVMVEGSSQRWYTPGFTGGRDLLAALPDVDDAGYAATCRALAAHDVRDRLAEIRMPVVAVAGRDDVATPVASLAEIADGVERGRLVVVPDAAHLPTVEQPAAVAASLVAMVTDRS
jgi:3-oxoadipate enol-lactonase/4-carboxymuconolactone decarboxylase